MAVDVSKIPNNNKFDPVRVAILNLQDQIEDTGATIGNGTLTINTSGDLLTGTGTFTANQSGNTTITIGVDGAEYISSISHNTTAQKLVLTFGDGTTDEVNLAQYIDDTNLARITSGSVNSTTGIATFTRDDNTTFTVDFSGFLEDDTLDSVTDRNNTTTNNISVGGIDLTYQDSDSKIRLESGSFTDSNDRYEILATGDVLMFQYYDDDQGDGTSVIRPLAHFEWGGASDNDIVLYGDVIIRNENSATPDVDAKVFDMDVSGGVVNLTNINDGTFSGDLVVGTTNVYDNLPDGISWSDTDNRLKIGVSKNVGGTAETAIQPILLANLLTEGYVPYVASGGAGSATVNSKVSDSWLKVTSDTLELGDSDPISHEVRYARFLWQSGQNDKISTVYGARDITASVQYSGGSATAKIAFTTGTGAGRIRFNNEYTFPAADGTSGQVLTTDGSGDLSWADASGSSITDRLLLQGGTDSTIGTMFVWRLSNSGSTGTTWRKVCGVSLPTGNWQALSMDIVLHYPSNNFGDSASLIDFRYTASFRRSSNSQDNLDNAYLYGNNVNYIRIVKTATGEYELQARAYLNNRGIIVEYMVTGGNADNVTPTTSNVNGSTTGTVYTATTASQPALETTGSINIDSDTVINANGFQGVNTYTQNLYITSSGTSALNRIDNNGNELYITYGGTSNAALQINNTSGDVSIQQSLGIYDSAASLGISGDTSGNIYYINSAGEHRFRANGSTVTSMTINSSLITLNENTEVNGTLTHDGLSMTDGTGIDQLKTYTQSLTLTTGWQDTGINGADLESGTYIFQLVANDYGVGGGHYDERYSGIMAWLDYNTNSSVADEIVISSRAGHAPNSGDIQLRILRTPSADADDLKLQIKANYNATGASNYTFKFRRLI